MFEFYSVFNLKFCESQKWFLFQFELLLMIVFYAFLGWHIPNSDKWEKKEPTRKVNDRLSGGTIKYFTQNFLNYK